MSPGPRLWALATNSVMLLASVSRSCAAPLISCRMLFEVLDDLSVSLLGDRGRNGSVRVSFYVSCVHDGKVFEMVWNTGSEPLDVIIDI